VIDVRNIVTGLVDIVSTHEAPLTKEQLDALRTHLLTESSKDLQEFTTRSWRDVAEILKTDPFRVCGSLFASLSFPVRHCGRSFSYRD
jgi:hypothetical protein